jgi:carbon monoxide dehydrogenase subunit G
MEVKLDKRYPVAATPAQAWAVLSDIHAVAACMPGAAITEQLDATHFKGTVKSKIGPAVMSFGGDIELQGLDEATRELKMLGKGADKAGSSASMQLTARLEPGEEPGTTVLMGQATITVSGKLAQFGSRLLVPVSDAMLAQFADNFRAAAAAVPVAAAPAAAQAPSASEAAADTAAAGLPAPAPAPAVPAVRAPAAPAQVKELNALGLIWTVFKGWLAGLFGKKP